MYVCLSNEMADRKWKLENEDSDVENSPTDNLCSFSQFKLALEYCTWVGFNSRWGSILLIFVFGWGSIRIFLGWGCIQDWGSIRVDTVDQL